MENVKKTPKVVQAFEGKMNKEFLGKIIFATVGILASFVIGHKAFNIHTYEYTTLTPQLEAKYSEMRKVQLAEMEALAKKQAHAICLAEKDLAKSKLTDILHRVEVSGEPNTLKEKLNRDCSVFEDKPQTAVPVAQAAIMYDGETVTIDKEDYVKYAPNIQKRNVQVTSYNPEVAQNDSTPCIAAGGHDICKLAKEGKKMIAVSRDLRPLFLEKKGQYFRYPAQVYVESSNPSIQGCYWIYDTMNARWKNRIDLFFMNRKENQGDMGWGTTISNDLSKC